MADEQQQTGVQKYLAMISAYDAEFRKWEARAAKIIKRYRDESASSQTVGDRTAKFNILWSNVQTLTPAVYARMPKADVSRRFGDNDQVGRVAALLIERALDFEIEHYPDFRATMTSCVQDRFLGGRGTAWVRYEPHVRAQEVGEPHEGVQVSTDADDHDEPQEEIDYECAPVDYVHWKDFGHSAARTWDEVSCVWRWVYMTRAALVERFGEERARTIALDSAPSTLGGDKDATRKNADRAKICELWDKDTSQVYWLSKNEPDFIDVRDDPLQLEGFFPCPPPLYATLTSDNLIPVPDFVLYQDQAIELDILSDRIDGLVKALRVRGVYDSSQPALQRLMTEGDNNALIPVDKWTAFSEKGGLKGSVDLLPLDMLAAALTQCYAARENIKAQIYEITGISDIVRGVTAASETATAQQIKGQYAGLRLRSIQEGVALFATSLLRHKAQVMCTRFQPTTILQYAAAEQLSDADKAMIPAAVQLMRDKPLLSFRIEVAADSLVQIDEQAHKEEVVEFVTAFGGFLEKAVPVAQAAPDLLPMVMELMRMGTRAFKQARTVEGTINQLMAKLEAAQQPGQPQPQKPPTPEEVAAQAEQAKAQMQMQIEQGKLQAQAQGEQLRVQSDQSLAAVEADTKIRAAQIDADARLVIEREKLAQERELAEMDIAARLEIARMQTESDERKAQAAAVERRAEAEERASNGADNG
jgi:hypothetical protein